MSAIHWNDRKPTLVGFFLCVLRFYELDGTGNCTKNLTNSEREREYTSSNLLFYFFLMKTLSSFIIEEQEAPSSKPKEYTSKELKSLSPMSVFSALGVKEYSTKRYPIIIELFDNGIYLFDKNSNQYTKDSEWPLYEKSIYIWNAQQNALLKANLIKNRELIKDWKLIEWWKYKRVTVDINWIVVSATPSAIDNQLNDLDPNFTTKVDWLPTHDELAEKISIDAGFLQHVIETTGSLNKETLKARWDITIESIDWNKIQKIFYWYRYSYGISSYWFDAWHIYVDYNKNTKERSVKGNDYEYGWFKELSYINFDEAIKIENMTNYCLRKAKTTFWNKAKDIDKPFTSTIGFDPNSSPFVALNDGYINDTNLFNIEDLYKNVRPTNLNEKDFVKRVIDWLNFNWNNYYRSALARKLKE